MELLNGIFYFQKPTVLHYSFISVNSDSDVTKDNEKLQQKKKRSQRESLMNVSQEDKIRGDQMMVDRG